MKQEVEKYIRTWEQRCYSNGIPDEVPYRLHQLGKAPSYKAIVIAILRNDLGYIGVSRKKSKYYDILKRIELKDRGVLNDNQLSLFDGKI